MRLFGRRNDDAHGDGNGAPHGAQGGTAVVADSRLATLVPTPGSRNGSGNGHHAPTDPAIFLTPDGWLVGSLVGATSEPDLGDVLANPLLRVIASDGSHELDRDDVMLIVPPAGGEEERVRSSRRAFPLAVDLGVAVLRGFFYALPGVSAWETWQRSTSGFVPVNGVVLDFPDGTSETAGRVLLSRHAVHSGLIGG